MKQVLAISLFILACSLIGFGQTESRADLLKQMETKRADLARIEQQFLAPAAEDLSAYSEFLAQPGTGLIRLLPREKFDPAIMKTSPITIRGGGAYYSFSRLTHEYGYGSDIELANNVLSVGFAGADYGMLAKIDGVQLDDVSAELPAVSFLAQYKPAPDEPAARVEQRRFSTGTVVDGVSYKRQAPIEVGATYVVRSISYGDGDVLAALKVVRQDTDGSLIIAWKLLNKFAKPQLARAQ